MKSETIVKQYYAAIAIIACGIPYAWGWPKSWLVAVPSTAIVLAAMLWLMRRMPLNKAAVNASTKWLVIAFAVLMFCHALVIRRLIGLPILVAH